MKKTYSRPDIVFECFSLSANIAATSCAKIVKTFADGNCGVIFGKNEVFMTNIVGCKVQVEDGSPMANYLCYHVPTPTNALFNS